MKKSDNEWKIGKDIWDERDQKYYRDVEINGEKYSMIDQMAGLTHAILLLVDAINDKKI